MEAQLDDVENSARPSDQRPALLSDEKPTLLVVEDDPGIQKQMRWSFDRYEVLLADDRPSAMAQLRRYEPAVVTMDLGLPPDPDNASEGFKLLEREHTGPAPTNLAARHLRPTSKVAKDIALRVRSARLHHASVEHGEMSMRLVSPNIRDG